MATREDYRDDLNRKIIAIEDSGYGDFEFTPEELNAYLAMSVDRLFPALYRKQSLLAEPVTSYGTNGYTKVTTEYADTVYLVVDTNEQTPLVGWSRVGTTLTKLDTYDLSGTVDLHYYAPFELPDDDVTDAEIPRVWHPVVILGALIEALESRQDSGVRGDPAPLGNNVEVPLLDRLITRYENLKSDLALALPVASV